MIRERLLNKLVTVYSISPTVSSSGDVTYSALTTVGQIYVRITDYKPDNINGKDFGMYVSSTNIIFCNPPSINIVPGNYIHDGTDKYKVNYVDKNPGGEMNHHWEILATLVEP